MEISEMSLEQLQDYALELKNEVAEGKTREADKEAQINDLRALNTTLQKRNNELFMKVEQQSVNPVEDQKAEQDSLPSCEDFASKNYKEIL